jgi:3-oxoadipate enol-lactonase
MRDYPIPAPAFSRTVRGTGPGLLLAHGAGGSVAANYGPILEGLAERRMVVGADYPGSGGTPRSAAPPSLDELADQLVAAADAEGLATLAIAGWSLGGPVAIRAAVHHPGRVTALVLTAPIIPPGTPEQTDLVGRVDVRAYLPRIAVPTQVISTTGDLLVSPALHQEVASGIPGAHFAELAKGHLAATEDPHRWLNLITCFPGNPGNRA